MISLEGVSARRKPASIKNVTVEWGPGVHAVVGTFKDGCALLLAVLVGAAKVTGGRIRVLDGAPTDARVRTQIARVGLDPSLPDGLRVDEALALGSVLRGDSPRAASERLAILGLEALARRPVRSLSRGEARGVALTEGLTSSRVAVLVIEEPLSSSDARTTSRIVEALRDKARGGCAIVVATASLRDAGELADDYVLMRAGALVGKTTSVHTLASIAPEGAALAILARDASDARRLVAALASEADITGVELEASVVKVRAADPLVLGSAVARAATQANVNVIEIRRVPPSRWIPSRQVGQEPLAANPSPGAEP